MTLLLFLAEGGATVGFGHISRCLSLASAVAKFGVEPEFRVAGGPAVEALVARAGFRVGPIHNIGNVEDVADVLNATNAAAVVIDSYAASESVFRVARIPTVVIDDLADRVLPVDVVLNPALGANELGYERLTKGRLLLGPRSALLRPEFLANPLHAIRSDIQRIFITLGGGDNGLLLAHLVDWCDSAAPAAIVEVAIGPLSSIPPIARTERLAILREPRMSESMARADLAIASGGHTLFELAAMGVPAIVIAIAANQRRNIEDFLKAGTIRTMGSLGDVDLRPTFMTHFEELRSFETRREMSTRAHQLVDGRGAERAASEIVTLARNSRRAADE